ncbi:ABC-type multidrug transport system, ATPase component [Pseudonocardia ammonioxydans]|uniref:ABC-type multidrug transport system, ATPase component n=1 Tax=Pseudonocardia ammonioxydans TaxID=260086 RepID=A0A1I4VG83_PSUAM|nr:ATP-binding cassette domain-containing protein [Pseudonocardia ammonioxydans]SFN00165.1 ABC-type multidrug transport system, ATPase component [Pseudonocardia ammonioxydans]
MHVPSRVRRSPGPLVALLLAGLLVPGLLVGSAPAAFAAADDGSVAVTDERVAVPAGPGEPGTVELDTALYVPASATDRTPAPAVLVAHGFGGDRQSVDRDARELADRGYVVQTWTARGFGTSGGTIGLNDPDREVADASRLLDRLAQRPEVQRDGEGDPRAGVTGGSYGGGLALLLAGHDDRVDAIAPLITWNDLGQALFPNNAVPAGTPLPATPAVGADAPDGVFKSGWAGVFFGSGGRVAGGGAGSGGSGSAESGADESGGGSGGGLGGGAGSDEAGAGGAPGGAGAAEPGAADDPGATDGAGVTDAGPAGGGQAGGGAAGADPADGGVPAVAAGPDGPGPATPGPDASATPTGAAGSSAARPDAAGSDATGSGAAASDAAGSGAAASDAAGAGAAVAGGAVAGAAAPGGAGAGAAGPRAAGSDAAGATGTGAPGTAAPAAPAAPVPGRPLTCGRFAPDVCAAYTEAARSGRVSPELADLLRRSSPATVTDRITAPTLLVQGEQDTLFGLDQADANARQIAADGTPVSVLWFAGGHDGGAAGTDVRAQIGDWFDQHLRGLPATGDEAGPAAATPFAYQVRSTVRTRGDTPTGRTVLADGYPGLTAPPVAPTPVPVAGGEQTVVHPAGGNPAAITSLPGLGSALGSLGSLGAVSGLAAPGQSARFVSEPLAEAMQPSGAPRVTARIARVPGQPAPETAVLFASVTALSPDGRSTLLGNAVAPLRVAVPADGSPAEVTVTLPGVVAPVTAGSRLLVQLATTDQAYDSGAAPAVWRVGLTEPTLSVPQVPGRTESASTVPLWPVVGIAGVLAAALLLWLVTRLRARRAGPGDTGPGSDPGVPLEVRALAKTYRNGFRAVSEVSFTVPRGAVLGLLGPNGAGKTTVLRMLMGLISPTSGEMRAFGSPIRPGAAVLSRIGAFVEGPGFLPHLSGAENLRLYWQATGRPPGQARMAETLEIAGLGDSVHRKVGTYSQGMRQRLAIAQAMLGLPELLILDEPTNGLDPPQIHAMRELLRRYASAGRTVLVSSHLLSEVEQTCTDVVVMHRGTVVADGTVAELTASGGGSSFTVDAIDRAAEVLAGLDGVTDVVTERSAGGASIDTERSAGGANIDTERSAGGANISTERSAGGASISTERSAGAASAGPADGPGVVHAHLDGTGRAEAVAALVGAGVAVSAAGPRGRLEDAFLELVGPEGRDVSGSGS